MDLESEGELADVAFWGSSIQGLPLAECAVRCRDGECSGGPGALGLKPLDCVSDTIGVCRQAGVQEALTVHQLLLFPDKGVHGRDPFRVHTWTGLYGPLIAEWQR